ncbi:hypothetical protein C0W35_03580 [Photobacterium kishitanii]|uniref:YitT family protein n=1 Tax=Photobacterium kishitanii TaxID=318456 RepID=A0AAX0YY34_9GAMM|nr:YitT family protein [Photobacterium kishitanii]PSU22130.1 hypothetical protein CTM84_07140 [Photobacterium kishitanii]PSU97477.1 hypothetical protein C0W35_03580 [Photobacterium kishitanii]PSV07196.1 hypothetical protein C0W96_04340 [Photobacterium kishitanii]PSV76888.1 hypothetical protein C0W29_04195 [Photobacterium kishitanii]PSW50767.1 hypothetical protein C0W66_03025 [Photobacterium kishitanii]
MHINKHPSYENVIAIFTGTLFAAVGLFLLQQSHLLTGGTAGLALLVSHFIPISLGGLYFILNCPFYLMAWFQMGKRFALSSILCGGLVSVMVDVLPHLITIEVLNPVFAAVFGGLLLGVGMLILFRHRTSLGGFNVLVLFLQHKFGISAGKIQLAIDSMILITSCLFISPELLILSIVGVIMINMVLAINYKPERYTATLQPKK